MIKEFEKMLKVLEKLNDYVKKEIASLEVIEEEYQHIRDLRDLDQDINILLIAFKEDKFFAIEDIKENLCYLDVNVGTYTWHIEQMRNITEKFIGLYREKVFLTQVEYE